MASPRERWLRVVLALSVIVAITANNNTSNSSCVPFNGTGILPGTNAEICGVDPTVVPNDGAPRRVFITGHKFPVFEKKPSVFFGTGDRCISMKRLPSDPDDFLCPFREFSCAGTDVELHNFSAFSVDVPPYFGTNLSICVVYNNQGTLLPFDFSWEPPVVSEVSPKRGDKDTNIKVVGSNFGTYATLIHVFVLDSDSKTNETKLKDLGTMSSAPRPVGSQYFLYFSISKAPPEGANALLLGIGVLNGTSFTGSFSEPFEFYFTDPRKSNNNQTGLIIGLSLGGAALAAIVFFTVFRAVRIRQRNQNLGSMRLLDNSWDRNWSIESHEVVFHEVVGRGSSALVYRGSWRGAEVGIKLIRNAKKRETSDFKQEYRILARLHHPSIVQLLGISIQEQPGYTNNAADLMLLTDFMSRGSLSSVLHETSDELPLRKMMAEAATGMLYLHKHKPCIIHRDLKTANILVDQHYHAKIADFGLSRVTSDDGTMTSCGTPKYAAPEVLQHSRYDTKADVWSFGVILWESFVRCPPYAAEAPMQVAFKIAAEGHQLDLGRLPPDIGSLAKACLTYEAKARPDFDQIKMALDSEEFATSLNVKDS